MGNSLTTAKLRAEGQEPPVFAILSTDALAYPVLEYYARLCVEMGLNSQANEVRKAAGEFKEWQFANVEQTKLPDHKHKPMSWAEEDKNE